MGDKSMKKVLRSFTFYFMLLSLFMIYMHYVGQDSKNIMLIHFNLILSKLQYNNLARDILNSGSVVKCRMISGNISVYWYFAHFITFITYGIVLDYVKLVMEKLR